MFPAICCMRLSCLSFSVSANFTTMLDDAPCNRQRNRLIPHAVTHADFYGSSLFYEGSVRFNDRCNEL